MNYTNLFDTNLGFMRERRADGSWNEPFAPETWSGGFTEGSSWHWTWCAFQDIPGLVKLMGGNQAFGRSWMKCSPPPPTPIWAAIMEAAPFTR